MADNTDQPRFEEDPLEELLDQESDEEFGLPEFKEHLADTLTPAVLKDWTAADFASIYVRFRPHLERHARRYLVNPSQVEEVVQDAFLYLMTSLPELDSELGVLKFLKWKTRLLALDVIRSNSRASFAPIDEQPEIASKDAEIGQDIERAEDAAIVSLALAKLQPRHREALIATLYEEKAQEVVAAQMGLSENAFRQLLFRARSAFKKALVGEAEVSGMSMSQILSVAARKAAAESGKYISAAGAFLLVLAISFGVLPNLSPSVEEQISQPTPATSAEAETQPETSGQAAEPQASDEPLAEEQLAAENTAESTQIVAAVTLTTTSPVSSAPVTTSSSVSASQEVDQERIVLESFLLDALDQDAMSRLSSSSVGEVLNSQAGFATITNGSGLTAYINYDLGTEQGIQNTWFLIAVDGMQFAAVPQAWFAQKEVSSDNGVTKLSYLATDLLVGDTSGQFRFIANDKSVVSTGALRIEIKIDPVGNIISSSVSLAPRR